MSTNGDGKRSSAGFPFNPVKLAENVLLQPPLTRRGEGPGLVLLRHLDQDVSSAGESEKDASVKTTLDPEPLQKWAEEGFAVVQIRSNTGELLRKGLDLAFKALRELPQCTPDQKVGLIAYNLTNLSAVLPTTHFGHELSSFKVAAIVAFSDRDGPKDASIIPWLIHTSSKSTLLKASTASLITEHHYEGTTSTNFVLPSHEHYQAGPAGVSHTRSLQFLKKHLGGPIFDLEAIWDEHTLYEFGERDVEKTMATMVEEPYVNHVPTLTGGIGRAALTSFYRDHFIFSNPPDTALSLISRTVGTDRIIDEFIFSFTHTVPIPWLIPGIPPTGRHVRVPFTSVVNVRGDRLYHEHIAWDQATVLRQLGLLPEWLVFPYPVDGRAAREGKRFEYRVPVAGVESAAKMVDENSVGSNAMLGFEIREVDDV